MSLFAFRKSFLTTSSTLSDAPFCNTAVWAGVNVRDVYCAARSVSTTQTIYTTYTGQLVGGSFTQRVLDDDLLSTSSVRTRSSSSPTRSQETQSTTSNDPSTLIPISVPKNEKSTPIGAIVGGAVGGVAVLALIGFGIWFIRRRNRKDKAAAVDSHGSQPPPVYHPSRPEIDGTGVIGKPAMTETQHPYAGAFAPADTSKGHEYQDQNQQQQYNNAGAVSEKGTATGTYEQRRESTLSPISPQSHDGSVGGSPQMTTRDSYVSTGYPPPPPATVGGQQVHEMSSGASYEMPASPVRKPVGSNRAGVGNAT